MDTTLKASYTVCELASMAGQSRYVTLKALESTNVPIYSRGRVLTVYLSDLRERHPALWDSILEILRLSHRAADNDDEDS